VSEQEILAELQSLKRECYELQSRLEYLITRIGQLQDILQRFTDENSGYNR
jgi:prefoldin subunit 5